MDMSNGNAVNILSTLLGFLCETETLGGHWPKSRFEKASLKRWAAGEMVEAILDHPNTPADDVVFEFWMRMCCYRIEASDEHAARVFSVAESFAEHLLDTARKEFLPDYE